MEVSEGQEAVPSGSVPTCPLCGWKEEVISENSTLMHYCSNIPHAEIKIAFNEGVQHKTNHLLLF